MKTLYINNLDIIWYDDKSVFIGNRNKAENKCLKMEALISLCNFEISSPNWEICLRNVSEEEFDFLIEQYKSIIETTTNDKRRRKTKKAGTKGNKASI